MRMTSPGGTDSTGPTQRDSTSAPPSTIATRPPLSGTRYVRAGCEGLGTSRYPRSLSWSYSSTVCISLRSVSARSCASRHVALRLRLHGPPPFARWIATPSARPVMRRVPTRKAKASIRSASGDPWHDHDVLSLRIEPVHALRRSPWPDFERGRTSRALLGEDPFRLLNGGHGGAVALLNPGNIPLVLGV